MKRDFPLSAHVTHLVRSMEPGKKYCLFDIRDLTGFDYGKSYITRKEAIGYDLIKEEQDFGKIRQFMLTPKGSGYFDKLKTMSDEDFFKSLVLEYKEKTEKIKNAAKHSKLEDTSLLTLGDKLKIKTIKRAGLKMYVPYSLTEMGKKRLEELKKSQNSIDMSLLSKRGLISFRRREKEALVLKKLEEPMYLDALSSEIFRHGNRIYYSVIARLVKDGYVVALEG